MFGLKIIKKKTFEKEIKRAEKNGEREGLWSIVDLLKKKDMIFLDEVTVKGKNSIIKDCAFFGKENKSCMKIEN